MTRRASLRLAVEKAPRIRFRHDGGERSACLAKEYVKKKYGQYKNKKVIFLSRDIRDVVVSYYFHRTRRMMEQHDLAGFVKVPCFGIDRAITFMIEWCVHRNIPKGFLLVRYEDLHHDPEDELDRMLSFIGIHDVTEEVISKAAEYSSFDNMRRMSFAQGSNIPRIASTSSNDPESYKTRKGKVGVYAEYLGRSDIEYIDKRLWCELAPVFGYSSSRGTWIGK